jgi:hypothetical protein
MAAQMESSHQAKILATPMIIAGPNTALVQPIRSNACRGVLCSWNESGLFSAALFPARSLMTKDHQGSDAR